ncbi:MAG TPA: ATP-binding protein, partial [Chroococcales cyanobacterium]
MSVRKRLTLLFVLLLAVIGLIQISLEITGLSGTLRSLAESNAITRLDQIQNYIGELHIEKKRNGEEALHLSSEEALPKAFYNDGFYVQITDRTRKVLNKSPNLGSFDFPTPEHAEVRIIDLPLPHLFYSSSILVAVKPLFLRGVGNVGWIQVGYPLQELNRALQHAIAFQIGGWLVGILLALGFGYYYAGRALAPIRRMTSEVIHWTESDLHRRLEEGKTKDELYRLAHTFNDLFNRLESAFEVQNRFVADASHELKSPLTTIKGNLQLLQRMVDAPSESRRQWLATTLKEVNRLNCIIKDMLDLARDDGQVFEFRPVDLVSLGKDVAESFQMRARLQVRPWKCPLWISGDEERLRRVLINLLENACRATSENQGEVFLEWERSATHASLFVRDTGVGIPAEAIPYLFDRFYRADKARSREQGGTGLGLSIAQA